MMKAADAAPRTQPVLEAFLVAPPLAALSARRIRQRGDRRERRRVRHVDDGQAPKALAPSAARAPRRRRRRADRQHRAQRAQLVGETPGERSGDQPDRHAERKQNPELIRAQAAYSKNRGQNGEATPNAAYISAYRMINAGRAPLRTRSIQQCCHRKGAGATSAVNGRQLRPMSLPAAPAPTGRQQSSGRLRPRQEESVTH